MKNTVAMKYRKGSYFSVDFPTVPSLIRQPRAIELRQVQYEHDILILKFKSSSHLWFDSLKTGTPVHLLWGSGTEQKNWYGYVSFVTRTTSASPENIMEVYCVGTSFVLKERGTKVFTKTTIPDAVKEIVEGFGFKFIGEQDDRVFDQLTLAGHSYWEWIQEQAKRIGYGVLVEGMSFVFRPLDNLINQGVNSIPEFTFSGSQVPAGSQIYDRTLDVFKVSNGEYVEDPLALRAVKHVGGVDPITSRVILESSSPAEVGQAVRKNTNDVLFSEVRSEQVVHDMLSATSASGGAAQIARMNMPATAIGQGDVKVRPFYPVKINGTGDSTDGFWITKKANHNVSQEGQYQIRLTLGIDGTGLNNVTEFRPAINSSVGVVDLTEVLKNGGRNINSFGVGAVTLFTPKNNFNEASQGLNGLGARWRYSAERNS